VVITVGANLMGRRSELCALDLVDVEFTADGLVLYVGRSKTDQQALGREVAIPHGVHAESDPVRLARRWLDVLAERGITEGPLLRAAGRGGRVEGG
jgi:hypothetical protein